MLIAAGCMAAVVGLVFLSVGAMIHGPAAGGKTSGTYFLCWGAVFFLFGAALSMAAFERQAG